MHHMSQLHEVPGCLMEAVITPILKKQGLDADSMKSYQPLSNIPFLAKVMERGCCFPTH